MTLLFYGKDELRRYRKIMDSWRKTTVGFHVFGPPWHGSNFIRPCLGRRCTNAVLAVMRRSLLHPRATADDAAADHPLVSSLEALRCLVFSPAATAAAPAVVLPATVLQPFLDAVCSEDASAAVTSASLDALHEVMALMGLSRTGAALREVMDAVASCWFEAWAEAAAEEVVLMRILQALLACLRAPVLMRISVLCSEHGDSVGRRILVGMHMDGVGKELLQWALNQATRSGDRVVAVHNLPQIRLLLGAGLQEPARADSVAHRAGGAQGEVWPRG
uniref:Uncharacterized protein n=1 Tax=Oryza sativa subsp. japonica TaxID=39947 RepID=Q6YTF4_ORYSJ|nr:hypothetical protein [Oryza sativa Japonica Group]